jgi:hypothetical protein
MANTFLRNTSNAIGTTFTTVYTAPVATTAIILAGTIANTSTTDLVNTEVIINDGTDDINIIGTATPLPTGTALSFVDGKLVLQAGDVLKVKASLAGQLDVYISLMEMS